MRLHREGLLTILLIILVSCLTVYAAWAWLPRVAVWPIAAVMAAGAAAYPIFALAFGVVGRHDLALLQRHREAGGAS